MKKIKLYLCEINEFGKYKVRELEVTELEIGDKICYVPNCKIQLSDYDKEKFMINNRIWKDDLEKINTNIILKPYEQERYIATVSPTQVAKKSLIKAFEYACKGKLICIHNELKRQKELQKEIEILSNNFKKCIDNKDKEGK